MRKLCPPGMKNLEYALLSSRTGLNVSLESLVVVSGRNLHEGAEEDGDGRNSADDLLDVREAPESSESGIKSTASGKDDLNDPLEDVVKFARDGHGGPPCWVIKYGTGGGIRTHKS